MNYGEFLLWMMTNPVGILLSLLILFVQFVVIMKIHHKAHNKLLHTLLSIWFIPQDIVVNMAFCTIVGLELPEEWLVTARMKRWKKLDPTGNAKSGIKRWRHRFATKLCNMLNKYDAGHC